MSKDTRAFSHLGENEFVASRVEGVVHPAAGDFTNPRDGVLVLAVDGVGGAKRLCELEPAFDDVDGDDRRGVCTGELLGRVLISRVPTFDNRLDSLVRKHACDAKKDGPGNVFEPLRRIPNSKNRKCDDYDGAAEKSGTGALRIYLGLNMVRTCHARSLMCSLIMSRNPRDIRRPTFGCSPAEAYKRDAGAVPAASNSIGG